jgi:hypothetical protein
VIVGVKKKRGSATHATNFHRYVKKGYYEQEWGEIVGKELEEVSYGE